MGELLAMPGIREECILRSNVGFMALHGGSQDRGTEQIAKRAAEQAGASYYAIVHPPGLRVHLTSRLHDPHHSAQLRAFLEHVDVAISVHGFGRDGFALWFDPDRGLVIEPYGPAVRGKQTGPLRGIIVGGLNAPTARRGARGCSTGASPATTSPTSGYGSGSIPTTRSTFHRPMVSRSSCPRACAESAISARPWFPARTGSSARWWPRSWSWGRGPPSWCARRRRLRWSWGRNQRATWFLMAQRSPPMGQIARYSEHSLQITLNRII